MTREEVHKLQVGEHVIDTERLDEHDEPLEGIVSVSTRVELTVIWPQRNNEAEWISKVHNARFLQLQRCDPPNTGIGADDAGSLGTDDRLIL